MPLVNQTNRRIKYLCRTDDGINIYISAAAAKTADPRYYYETFRLYIGDGTTMREVAVDDVVRYRDGGTTYIYTGEGEFFFPSPTNARRDASLTPKWGSEELVALSLDDYDIVETLDRSVTITKR